MVKKALPKFVTSAYGKPTFTGQWPNTFVEILSAFRNGKLT